MANNKVVLYTSINVPNCPSCLSAKKLLRAKHMPFDEIVIGKDLTKVEFQEQYGPNVKTVPQIVIDGKRIGGFEDLVSWMMDNKKEDWNDMVD